MLASYNSDTDEIEWFKNFKMQLPEMTEEVKTFWDALEKDPDVKITNERSFLEIADDLGVADNTFKDFIKTTKESGTVYKTSEDALAGYQSYLKSTGKAAQFADLKTKALSASMKVLSTIGWMAISYGISLVVEKAIKGVDYLIHYEERQAEAYKKAEEAAASYAGTIWSVQEETKKMADSANGIAEKYAKLAQGVNVFTNANFKLTNDEYTEFLDLNNQFAKLFPSLTKSYDENGNAILGLGGNVDTVVASIQRLVEQQQRLSRQTLKDNLESYVEGDGKDGGQLKAIEGQLKEVDKLSVALHQLEQQKEKIFNRGGTQAVSIEGYEKFLKDVENKFGKAGADALKSVAKLNFDSSYWKIDYDQLQMTGQQKNAILASYDNYRDELFSRFENANAELANMNSELSAQMMVWVEDLPIYEDNGSYFQSALSSMIQSIDWASLGLSSFDDVKNFIQENILTPLQVSCQDPDAKAAVMNAFKSLFSLDASSLPYEDARKAIDGYLKTIMEACYLRVKAYGIEAQAFDKMANRYASAATPAEKKAQEQMIANATEGMGKDAAPAIIGAVRDYSKAAGEKLTFEKQFEELFGNVASRLGGFSTSSPGGSASKSAASGFKGQIDWVAESIASLTDEIGRLDSSLKNAEQYSARLGWSDKLIKKNKQLAATYRQASAAYKEEFSKSASGLPKKYVSAIKGGNTFKVEDFSGKGGEKTYNKIQEVIAAWRNYQKALADEQGAWEAVADAVMGKASLVQEAYGDRLDNIAKRKGILENEVAALEAKGLGVSAKYYKELTALEEERRKKLAEEKSGLEQGFSDAVSKGDEAYQKLSGVNKAIVDAGHTNLSYSGAAKLAALLGLGNVKGADMVGNEDLKKKMLDKLMGLGLQGFSTGGVIKTYTGEDGLLLAQKGESVMSKEATALLRELSIAAPAFMRPTAPQFEQAPSQGGQNVTVSEGAFHFDMPNVVDAQGMVRELQNDRRLQKAVKQVVFGEGLGDGRLGVNRI